MAVGFIKKYGEKVVKKHTNTAFMFPKDDIPTSEKGKDWCLQNCRAVLYKYFSDQSYITSQRILEIRENRMYGAGRQPVEKYKQKLMPEEPDSQRQVGAVDARKGWYNVNWSPISYMPKIKRILETTLKDEYFEAICFCIDEKSGIDREIELNKLLIEKYVSPLEKAAMESVGETYVAPDYIPQDINEINLIKISGGIKLAREIATEKCVQAALFESNWDGLIQKKLLSDIIENSVACTKTETNIHTGRVVTRYVDIERLICPFTNTYEYTNMAYAGEIVDWNIRDLKKVLPEVPEEEWMKLANTYSKRYGNRELIGMIGMPYGTDSFYDKTTGTYMYDDFTIPVLDCEWQSIDADYYINKTDSKGRERFITTSIEEVTNEKKSEKKKSQVVKNNRKVYYGGKMVLGTDYIFDFGKVYNIGWGGNKSQPKGSYSMSRVDGVSLVETLKEFIDAMNLTWFQLQNAISTAGPDVLTIETDAISRAMNGAKVKPQDLLKMKQTGIAPWKRTSKNPVTAGKSEDFPFDKIPGGIGSLLNELIALFDVYWNLQQRLSGMTDAATGVNPTSEQGLGVSEIALNATDNAIRPLFSACINIKQMTAEAIQLKIQALAYTSEYKSYYNIIGTGSADIIKLTKNEALFSYGIGIKIRPTKEQRRKIETEAANAMHNSRDGQPALTFNDYLFIMRTLDEGGNLKMAELYLAYKIDKRRIEAQQDALNNVKAQSQEIQNQIAIKNKGEIELDNAKTDNQIKLEFWKSLFAETKTLSEKENQILMIGLDNLLNGGGFVAGGNQSAANVA